MEELADEEAAELVDEETDEVDKEYCRCKMNW